MSARARPGAGLIRLRRLACLGLLAVLADSGTACAQSGSDAALRAPSATTIRKSCGGDHVKFCPYAASGTAADVSCLSQHHIGLTLGCRNVLGRVARAKAAATP